MNEEKKKNEKRLLRKLEAEDCNFEDIDETINPKALTACESNSLLMAMKVSNKLAFYRLNLYDEGSHLYAEYHGRQKLCINRLISTCSLKFCIGKEKTHNGRLSIKGFRFHIIPWFSSHRMILKLQK